MGKIKNILNKLKNIIQNNKIKSIVVGGVLLILIIGTPTGLYLYFGADTSEVKKIAEQESGDTEGDTEGDIKEDIKEDTQEDVVAEAESTSVEETTEVPSGNSGTTAPGSTTTPTQPPVAETYSTYGVLCEGAPEIQMVFGNGQMDMSQQLTQNIENTNVNLWKWERETYYDTREDPIYPIYLVMFTNPITGQRIGYDHDYRTYSIENVHNAQVGDFYFERHDEQRLNVPPLWYLENQTEEWFRLGYKAVSDGAGGKEWYFYFHFNAWETKSATLEAKQYEIVDQIRATLAPPIENEDLENPTVRMVYGSIVVPRE